MDGTLTLDQVEACEAMRAYLVLRGALPAHGKVESVKGDTDYGDVVKVTTSIAAAPAT